MAFQVHILNADNQVIKTVTVHEKPCKIMVTSELQIIAFADVVSSEEETFISLIYF